MKALSFLSLILLVFFLSCNVSKDTNSVNSQKNLTATDTLVCPEGGQCKIKYYSNKSLKIKKDDLNKFYYLMVDDNSKSIIQFEYKKNTPADLLDGNYSEEVIFEITNSDNEINLSDEFLSKVKMLFGKHCYCKGEAGVYEINQGLLRLKQDQNKVEVSLTFNVNQVKHIVKSLKFTVLK